MSSRLAKNISALSVLQVLTYVLPLVTVPYLVRVVGVHNYGLIAFSLSLAALIQIFCDYGFNLSATKEIVSQRNSAVTLSRINASVILIKCLLLLTTLGLMLATVNFTGDMFKDHWLYFFSLIAAAGNTLLPIWYFQGMEKMKYLLMYGVISRLAYTFLIFYFVVEPDNYILVPLLSGLCGLFSSFLAIGYIRSIGHLDFQCVTVASLKMQIINGWDIFISSVWIGSYNAAVPIVLGITASMEAVGIYAGAEKLLKVVKGLYNPISQALFPHMSALLVSAPKSAMPKINMYIYRLFAFTFLSSTLLLLFANLIIEIVLGSEFKSAVLLLKVFSFIPFFACISNIFGVQLMLNLGYSKEFKKIIIFLSLIGLVLTCSLSIFFQEIGAAVSILLIEFLMAVGMFLFFKIKVKGKLL